MGRTGDRVTDHRAVSDLPAGRWTGRTPYLAPEFDPRAGLRGLVAFGAFGLGTSALYAATGLGFPCPFRALTGWDCPLCGGTRLGNALLHLDVATAFRDNPLVLIGLALLSVLGVLWLVEVAGGPKLRPPTAVGLRLRRVHPTVWLLLGIGVGVVYTVLRNLFFPI